jgi:hypothetical protein
MNTSHFPRSRPADRNLTQVIEPLASYICASERPREALLSVLAALKGEVEALNRAARGHFGSSRARSLELVA